MISLLRGKIISQEENRIILDVNGVGYELLLSGAAIAQAQDKDSNVSQNSFYTYMHVKDDGIDLYGFASQDEKRLFQQIITVSGAGCRTALNILLSMTSEQFIAAIHGGDRQMLTRVNGVGKKTADRLILELRDALGDLGDDSPLNKDIAAVGNNNHMIQDALVALSALGYSASESETMIKRARSQIGETNDLQLLLKTALSIAGRRQSN